MPGCHVSIFYYNYMKIKFKILKQKQRSGECTDLVSGFFTLCKVADRKTGKLLPAWQAAGGFVHICQIQQIGKVHSALSALILGVALSPLCESMTVKFFPKQCQFWFFNFTGNYGTGLWPRNFALRTLFLRPPAELGIGLMTFWSHYAENWRNSVLREVFCLSASPRLCGRQNILSQRRRGAEIRTQSSFFENRVLLMQDGPDDAVLLVSATDIINEVRWDTLKNVKAQISWQESDRRLISGKHMSIFLF